MSRRVCIIKVAMEYHHKDAATVADVILPEGAKFQRTYTQQVGRHIIGAGPKTELMALFVGDLDAPKIRRRIVAVPETIAVDPLDWELLGVSLNPKGVLGVLWLAPPDKEEA
jgi:hypothetical protein